MSFADQSILDELTVRWQVDLSRGMAAGADRFPFLPYVRPVEGSAQITDPLARTTKIVWFEGDMQLKKDTGQVQFKALPVKQQSIEVDSYVDGIAEQLSRLREPAIAQMYSAYASNWGARAVRYTQYKAFWERLLVGDTLEYGAGSDGQALFDTDHPGADSTGSATTFSNLFDLALSETNLDTILQAMAEYRDTFGQSWGNVIQYPEEMGTTASRFEQPRMGPNFTLVTGPKLQTTARNLARMAVENPSVFAGSFVSKCDPEITGAFEDYWFVMFTADQRRPLMFIDAGSVVIPTTDISSEPMRQHRRAEWVLRADFGFAYDTWHACALSRGA